MSIQKKDSFVKFTNESTEIFSKRTQNSILKILCFFQQITFNSVGFPHQSIFYTI